jgi:hypothetical protein
MAPGHVLSHKVVDLTRSVLPKFAEYACSQGFKAWRRRPPDRLARYSVGQIIQRFFGPGALSFSLVLGSGDLRPVSAMRLLLVETRSLAEVRSGNLCQVILAPSAMP